VVARAVFPPQTPEGARQELEQLVQRSPTLVGLPRSRWWLDGLRQRLSWLHDYSLVGVHRLLRRFNVRYKRGRTYVHSPDPDYDLKLLYVQAALSLTRHNPQRYVFLYQDELTYFRRPTVARAYAPSGHDRPRALQGTGSNTTRRIAGVLNALTGQLIAWQRDRFDRHTLLRFYQAVQAAYPQAERIFIVQDNWPVHFHPDILLGLSHTKICLLRLPTYAPWTNPHEKVWLRLYQQVLHLHEQASDWLALQQRVQHWLDQFRDGSTDLLRFVGLLPT
jgi:hypothetical protein